MLLHAMLLSLLLEGRCVRAHRSIKNLRGRSPPALMPLLLRMKPSCVILFFTCTTDLYDASGAEQATKSSAWLDCQGGS